MILRRNGLQCLDTCIKAQENRSVVLNIVIVWRRIYKEEEEEEERENAPFGWH
jgi:hypothetical protein